MSLLIDGYKNNIVGRYDKDPAIPYYSHKDFPHIHFERNKFLNSINVSISYYFYNYGSYDKNKIILFLPGIGPGHTAYLKEINELCRVGFKVLTLDYTGCGESGGDALLSLNEPTRDVNDLLTYLDLKQEIIVVGHSLGAYTALNLLAEHEEIKTGVIISCFISLYNQFKHLLKLSFLAKKVCNYEKKIEPDYYDIDVLSYLRTTEDKILFIHSIDDSMVGYKLSAKVVESLNNQSLSFYITNKKNHNPTYTKEAVNYLGHVFKEYRKLIKNKTLNTEEKRKEFFSTKSIDKMTEMDKEVILKIVSFIKN